MLWLVVVEIGRVSAYLVPVVLLLGFGSLRAASNIVKLPSLLLKRPETGV
jgi:hypothetical protein